ncbi:glycosyl hydrolase superfamily protein [Striga asiatica]|uniref:Glycosyl hydrolase superfamily protein n=1 Tax=Striga asiatica TaxID=4170 RepID=A0A5A7QQE0_STRAF|nr:glycosyl hydrolase superfamily protein [Striga asiatica]
MPEFGDEFIIESFKVPWLIWIQLIVTILLLFLLFLGFGIFTSDLASSSSSAASSSTAAAAAPPVRPNKPHRRIKVGDQRVPRGEETSEGLIGEENQSEEESSLKDSGFVRIFRSSNHPCNYFGLAKQALFKCFGLDSSSEPSSRHRPEKQD